MSDIDGTIRRMTGVIAAAIATCGLLQPAAALAQEATAQSPTAPAHVSDMDSWRRAMVKTTLPGKGCFTTSYPDTEWREVQCVTAPPRPPTPPPARVHLSKTNVAAADVGNGNDYSAQVASGTTISQSEAGFTAVSGVTSESENGVANEFSLQLNANQFITSACAGKSNCTGWAQFVYGNPYQALSGPASFAAAYIQYWLLGYGTSCPNSAWTNSGGSCFYNSPIVEVPLQSIASLSSLVLTGMTGAGGSDTVAFSVGSTLYRASNSTSNDIGLAGNWNTAEFNIFGDGDLSEATFNPGATLAVRTSIDNGTTNAPTCMPNGTTGETNSLTLAAPCCPFAVKGGGGSPGIVFLESSASPLPAPNCAALTNISPLASDYDSIANTQEVFYLGSDQHIHELYYTGTSWGTQDATATAGGPAAAINSPLVSDHDPLANTQEIYYLGSDQNVYELFYTGTSWGAANVTAAAGGPAAVSGSPMVSGYDPIAKTLEVYYIGANLHVYALFYTGTSWGAADVTATAGAPAVAPSTSLVGDHDPIVNTQEIYYLGSDQHVHELYYNGTSWQTRDATAAAGGLAAVSGSPLVSDYDPIANTEEIYYLGSDQHVHELYYTGTIWGTGDPTAASGAPAVIPGSSLVSNYDSIANTLEVYYVGSDLHVYELYYTGSSWGAGDVTAFAGAPAAAPGGPLVGDHDPISNTQEVYYLGGDLHVHELYYNGTAWATRDSTAAAGAPSAQ